MSSLDCSIQEMMYMGTMIEDSIQKAIEALIDQNAQLAVKNHEFRFGCGS